MESSVHVSLLATAGFTLLFGFLTTGFTIWKMLDFAWPVRFWWTWTGTLIFFTGVAVLSDLHEKTTPDPNVLYALGLLWLFTASMRVMWMVMWWRDRQERNRSTA